MRILLSLLVFALAFNAFAEEKVKDTSLVLRGEKTPGAGYKVYFSEDKNTFINLSGYARMMTEYSLDDHASSDATKFKIPYFRLLLDGQSDKFWSWHTRMDYSQAFSMSKTSPAGANYGAPSIYFARAYLTYSANDNFKIDFGRIGNLIYRYDVMNNANVRVGFGVMPRFTYNDFSFTTTVNYGNNAQRLNGTDSEMSADGVAVNQLVTIGSRAGYNFKFNKDYSLTAGLMVNTETGHSREKATQIMPDIMFNGPSESYILNQTLKRTSSRYTANVYENYTEAGFGINGFWYPDINYRVEQSDEGLTPTYLIADTKHTVATELILKHSPQISTFYSLIYEDYLAKVKANKAKKFQAYIHYDF